MGMSMRAAGEPAAGEYAMAAGAKQAPDLTGAREAGGRGDRSTGRFTGRAARPAWTRVRGPLRLAGGFSAALLLVAGCGTQRNCLVIPVQVQLVEKERETLMSELENGARQVDRVRTTLEQAKERVAELQREKALLDSLNASASR
jgi:hypothetical protein